MTEEGMIVRREDGAVVVTVPGQEPKIFTKKKIYLPGEFDRAIAENLLGNDVVVVGMNGYSSLTAEKCAAWGVKPGAYEAATASLLMSSIFHLQKEYPGINIRLVHGASDMGVDRSVVNVAKKLNLPQLGFSCPRFMLYVNDDDVPVCVSASQAEYSDAFIRALDILIAANGRMQSFKHDINAAFEMLKHVIPVNVIRSISNTGGPPAIGADGQIEDAVAAFEQRVHLISIQLGIAAPDPWLAINHHVRDQLMQICRMLISPERAFGSKMPTD